MSSIEKKILSSSTMACKSLEPHSFNSDVMLMDLTKYAKLHKLQDNNGRTKFPSNKKRCQLCLLVVGLGLLVIVFLLHS